VAIQAEVRSLLHRLGAKTATPVRRWLAQRDMIVMLALLLAVALMFGFLQIADAVSKDRVGFEQRLMLALRDANAPHDPVGPPWFESMWVDVTALGSGHVLSLLALIVLGYLAMLREWRTALVFAIAMIGAAFGGTLLKGVFERPRPEVISQLIEVGSLSFPSGHSLSSAVMYPTLGAMIARLVKHVRLKLYVVSVALLMMVLIGVSRVYLGVHYPSDVLAGWMLGLGWATLCWTALRALQRRHVVEPPGIPPTAGAETTA
jgi:undecaprenyl-diphosphatase